jgi:hemolysin activation/secretion protein
VFQPVRRLTDSLMFLPIVGYADGYGFTYGGRVSTVDLLGAGERLSVPLTWGGTRRIALEFERPFKRGPLTRILASAALWRRENPHFEIGDRRVEFSARAERQIGRVLRTGVDTSRSSVRFGSLDDRLWTLGANAVLDTALDPSFRSNAVWLGAGWTGLYVRPGVRTTSEPRINLYTTEARGYLRVIGQAVAAARVRYSAADGTLPPYERLLLGGSSSVRGFRTGTFIGDRRLIASGELRVPLTTVLSAVKLGVTGFVDAGKAYDYEQRIRDARWHRGAGAGAFMITRLVNVTIDVAHGIDEGDTRLHLSSGFSF